MTHKLAQWNKRATDEKFINEIIFIVISPAYLVTGVIDAFIVNTMEFWSGSNPMANVGKTREVMGQDGRYYAVTTLRDGYEVKKPDGEKMQFLYDKKTDSWSQVVDGKRTEIFRFNADGTIRACLPGGRHIDVKPDAAGVYQVRTAVNGGTYWAMR